MDNKYKILFSLIDNLYADNAPLLIEAGVLVVNTENGKTHVQLKFKNLSNRVISMVKIELTLMDSVGRVIGCDEKQYLDLDAKSNQSFGSQDPARLSDNTARRFSVAIKEICFSDRTIWTAPENAVWKPIPKPQAIREILPSDEAIDEFETSYCGEALFFPLVYEDLWVCSCGNVNKKSGDVCASCGAWLSKMLGVNDETLKNENIYRKATELTEKHNFSAIGEGIALFEKIPSWKDSAIKAEEARKKLDVVTREEQQEQKKKKKNLIIALSCIAAIVVLIIGICIVSSAVKADKYAKAQAFLSDHKYREAMELLEDLSGYKDADEMYTMAFKIVCGDYQNAINWYNLTEFYIPEDTLSIKEYAFKGCTKLEKVFIPDSVTSIGRYAFEGCSKLTSITIPNSVMSIGNSAFSYCSGLTSITIPDSVTSIEERMFYGCSRLTSVTIGNSVTSIGNYAFSYCSGLTSVTIGNGVTSIGWEAFSYCSRLTSVTIGNSVTSIGNSAFYGCSSLTNVTIPDSVTSIGDLAFDSCSSLTSITIPNSVTSIGDFAFYKCGSLKEVNYKGTQEQWNNIEIGKYNSCLTNAKRNYIK